MQSTHLPSNGQTAPDDAKHLRAQIARLDRQLFDYRSLLRASRALHDCRNRRKLLEVFSAMVFERVQPEYIEIYFNVGTKQGQPDTFQHIAHFDFKPALSEVEVPATEGISPLSGAIKHSHLSPTPLLRTATPTLPPVATIATIGQEPNSAFTLSPGVLSQLVTQGEPIEVADAGGNPRFPNIYSCDGPLSRDTRLWLPLVMEGRVQALATLGPSRAKEGYELHQEFLRTLSEQTAVALASIRLNENLGRLNDDLERTIKNLSALYDISRMTSQLENMNHLLKQILQSAAERVHAARGSIMLFDTSIERLVIRVVQGLPDKDDEERINRGELECRTFARGEGIAGIVFERGRPYLSSDVNKDAFFEQGEQHHTQSMICVPLRIRHDDHEPIGVLNICNKSEEFDAGEFTPADVQILQEIALQAAITIDRAQQYQIAITDELTGLFVRRHLQQKAEEEIRRHKRHSSPVSIILIDIDHFKQFNDTHGHDVGDLVLQHVAMLFRKTAREVDVVSRYGGEEFAILLPDTDLAGACCAAERCRVAIERSSFTHRDQTFHVNVSIGVAELRDHQETLPELIKRADLALYRSKAEGRNQSTAALPPLPDAESDLDCLMIPAIEVQERGAVPTTSRRSQAQSDASLVAE